MTPIDGKSVRRSRLAATAALVLLIVHGGCGTEDVEIPELTGPSETGLSVALTADPDLIVADGLSTSLVQATLRGPDGRPLAGKDVFFSIADDSGRFADLGTLSANGAVDLGTGVVVRTNAQGIAFVVYKAPPRTDATANQFVSVAARPIGQDGSSAFYRTVRIELRSAEPRLFPQNPNNLPPRCGFAVEVVNGSCTAPPNCTIKPNSQVLFQSTSVDPDGTIVRYWWDFGNGRRTDSPDAATAYALPGAYSVVHVVTDNNGAQAACGATITVRP